MTKRNAIILAAGTSSRFVPLSVEFPKGLIEVKGEILIERQIRQLKDAGISDITLVVGYKAEMFAYLRVKFGVEIVLNEDFDRYNNTSSVIRVIEKLDNTFICSSDNYFTENVFIEESEQSYYSALYSDGETGEYCLSIDGNNNISEVSVGGHGAWFMVGHAFFNHEFSEAFRKIMIEEYRREETKQGYWEDVYIRYLNRLPKMKINCYREGVIQEFDSLDELRLFDGSYLNDTRSTIIKQISKLLSVPESKIHSFMNIKQNVDCLHFSFKVGVTAYEYSAEKDVKIVII